MPRKNRFYAAGLPVHVIQRGNNKQQVFFNACDNQMYLQWLKEAAEKYHCAIHAYVLMDNHLHLLLTPSDAQGISRMMQYVGRYYVPYINKVYDRSGTLWEGRYKSNIIDAEDYFLSCSRYIEMNPVMAGMVRKPSEYVWSSYAANAESKVDEIISQHAIYHALGNTDEERRLAYTALFRRPLKASDIANFDNSCQTGTPLGNREFIEKLEHQLQRKVGYARQGRPAKVMD